MTSGRRKIHDLEENDVALKLLHTADWHLGRRFPSFEKGQEERLTRARLEAVRRILDLAASWDVDAVLCAGDLFDEPVPEKLWWQGLLREFERRDWRRSVVLLPGNHDPIGHGAVYHGDHPFRQGLPDYVHVVDRSGWELPLGDGAVLYASPCESKAGQTDLVASLPRREPGDERFRIGMVHGQTFDVAGHQTNFPIACGSAAERGFDYLALGDTHGFREVEPDAPAPTVYPGAPEATTFNEPDAGYAAIVFFPRDRRRRARVLQERVGSWAWREETCRSMDELRRLKEAPNLQKTVMRLVLKMELPMAGYDEAERVVTELGGSMASTPLVGVLDVERSGLRLASDAPIDFESEMPMLEAAAERLREDALARPEVVERALHHLYRLVRDQA